MIVLLGIQNINRYLLNRFLYANRRLPARNIKKALRLKFDCGISEREISRSCLISRGTVADYVRRATIIGLKWAEAVSLTHNEIEDRLFPAQAIPNTKQCPLPEFNGFGTDVQMHI
jgi:hypothetical protein